MQNVQNADTNFRFSVISIFSGCGGSSFGYKLAGGKVLLAVEWDNNAVETYRLNFPETPIYHGDIKNLSIDECLQRANIKPYELDIFDGSPPCQGFSTAGKRILDDSRNQLFREYIRLLRGIQPKVFVMENVSGMVKGKMKLIFVEILKELKSSGYQVKAKLMNTMYFNVPQSRERIIFIGVRNDLNIMPTFPKAQTRPITVREALKDCPIGENRALDQNSRVASIMRIVPQGKSAADYHPKGSYFNKRRLAWNKPSPTLAKNGGRDLFFPEGNRFLTDTEYRRLASYPDWFRFVGNGYAWTERIGNSVPPNFMRAIAEHIDREILTPKRGTENNEQSKQKQQERQTRGN